MVYLGPVSLELDQNLVQSILLVHILIKVVQRWRERII